MMISSLLINTGGGGEQPLVEKLPDGGEGGEQPLVEKVPAGGGERPLGEKLPDGYEVKGPKGPHEDIWMLTGAIELHRLVVEDFDQLKKRKDEITSAIIDSKCSVGDLAEFPYEEVSPPASLPSSSAGHTTVPLCLYRS